MKTITIAAIVVLAALAVFFTAAWQQSRTALQAKDAACDEALNLAEDGFTFAGEGFAAVQRVFEAVGGFDRAAIAREREMLERTGGQVHQLLPQYRDAAAACRAA